jgi:hypothetical protein
LPKSLDRKQKPRPEAASDSKQKKECFFFLQGNCTFGNQCDNYHDIQKLQTLQKAMTEMGGDPSMMA